LHRESFPFNAVQEEQIAALQHAQTGQIEQGRQSGEGFELGSELPISPSAAPGGVAYSSPQTLMNQREQLLKSKSYGSLFAFGPAMSPTPRSPSNGSGSIQDYPLNNTTPLGEDADEIPLSQRRQMIRQSSTLSMAAVGINRASSSMMLDRPESAMFDSHQPKRLSSVPNANAREARLANFRMSVAHDLGAGTPVLPSSGRETPFSSMNNVAAYSREAEVQRGIEAQRNMIMRQKEAEAQQKESQRRQKEQADRVFDERMRNGDLLEAHREVMRKMQHQAYQQQ
jgi:hypothetical protein